MIPNMVGKAKLRIFTFLARSRDLKKGVAHNSETDGDRTSRPCCTPHHVGLPVILHWLLSSVRRFKVELSIIKVRVAAKNGRGQKMGVAARLKFADKCSCVPKGFI